MTMRRLVSFHQRAHPIHVKFSSKTSFELQPQTNTIIHAVSFYSHSREHPRQLAGRADTLEISKSQEKLLPSGRIVLGFRRSGQRARVGRLKCGKIGKNGCRGTNPALVQFPDGLYEVFAADQNQAVKYSIEGEFGNVLGRVRNYGFESSEGRLGLLLE
jgi:hypothetical protein